MMAGEYGAVCRIQVMPADEGESGAAACCFGSAQARIDTTARIEYQADCLIVRGLGFDGRCSFCRYFRLKLKHLNIPCKVDCPFEVMMPGPDGQCLVEIGGRYFNQAYIEDESSLRECEAKVKQNRQNVEAYLAMGVIYEYHGRFVDGMSAYWKAYELNNSNSFVRARLKEILEFLMEIIPDS